MLIFEKKRKAFGLSIFDQLQNLNLSIYFERPYK